MTSSAVSSAVSSNPTAAGTDELRGVWIAYYEISDVTTFEKFKTRIDGLFDSAKAMGFNAVFMHVRSHGDAFYYSDIFPMSHYIGFTDKNGNPIQGVDPGYDPLAYAVSAAHARGLELHAWINPYRVWTRSGDITELAATNPARLALEDGDKTNDSAVIIYKNGIYYNPASAYARKLIIAGVSEIVKNYAVDGVHFDDYFYPTADAAFDADSYAAYQTSGGRLALADWRRENVSKLISETWAAVKAVRDIPFGVSPAGNIERDENELYADVKLWGGTAGYVDYLTPQIYWGFKHETYPFTKVMYDWVGIVTSGSVKLYIGLPAYKLGRTDSGAGSGKNEFTADTEILARMTDALRAAGCDGFTVFSISSLTDTANAAEAAALTGRMKE